MDYVGRKVKHQFLGEGEIDRVEGRYIYVQFSDRIRQLSYDYCMEHNLIKIL